MTDTSDGKRDLFISFNQADRSWATWIAWVLEDKGYSVFFQDWDFRGNFVEHMNRAHAQAHRTLAVLSDHYFGSGFTLAEWSARFAQDPAAREDRLVPVKVGTLTGETILGPLIYADLANCGETEAERRLLERVRKAIDPTYRPKPKTRPGFPGAPAREVPEKPRFPVPLHNLPPANPDFVGRENVLAQLDELLSQGQGQAVLTQAITGLGGIGKTQTALAYCYQHLSAYTLVWWLRAEQTATLTGQFVALAPHLGLDSMMSDQAVLAALVRDTLARRGGFLLVFDNLEEPEVLPAFLPRTGGTVLITARQQDWHGRAKTLPLDVMTEPEAVRLLTGRPDPEVLPPAELAEATALAQELDHLPLALAQARDYMVATGETCAGYQALLVASRPTVLATGHARPDYPATVAKTWDVSIRAAEKKCPAARELLELLAFFAPDPLPLSVLVAAPDALPEPLRDSLARNRALAALTRFSLVTAAQGSLTVHRLVQAVTRDGLGPDRAAARAKCAVLLTAVGWPSLWDHKGWSAVQALMPHALAAAQAAARHAPVVAITSYVLGRVATYFEFRGAYGEARPLFEQALAIGEKTLGCEHPNVAARLDALAQLYYKTGHYAAAEPLYERALAIYEKALGREDIGVATVANNLANLYYTTDRYTEAEPLYERALAIYEKALGREHPSSATVTNNLAELYRATDRYTEAEPLFQRAIAILEKALPPNHPHRMRVRENYARLLDQLGRPTEAAELRAPAQAVR